MLQEFFLKISFFFCWPLSISLPSLCFRQRFAYCNTQFTWSFPFPMHFFFVFHCARLCFILFLSCLLKSGFSPSNADRHFATSAHSTMSMYSLKKNSRPFECCFNWPNPNAPWNVVWHNCIQLQLDAAVGTRPNILTIDYSYFCFGNASFLFAYLCHWWIYFHILWYTR